MIDFFESLPGIGPRTAQRLTFYLLRSPKSFKKEFGAVLTGLDDQVKVCQQCFNIAEGERCSVCQDPRRDQDVLCVVEEPLDLIAIEQSGYKGLYHCLGGALSPLNNIGPDELRIEELLGRVKQREFKEVILATNPSVEGEATAMFIKSKIQEQKLKIENSLKIENCDPIPEDTGIATNPDSLRSSWIVKLKITRLGRGLPVGADVEYADAQTLARSLEGRSEY